uniref:SCO2521 family protein n=1 Tax=Streptomyces sp. NBC_00093 TaxID=2975649 RepID=A0AAU1ZVF3_9ACTN
MAAAGERPDTVLACGEVRTTLLANSRSLAVGEARELLRLGAADGVRHSTRPNLYVVSPDVLTGVDCLLPTATGARVRAVGTVGARAALTEGRVLQSSARFCVSAAGDDQRRSWGRYLAEPGVLRPVGRLPEPSSVAEGFLEDREQSGRPALGAVAERLLAQVLRHPLLDHRPPVKSRRTHLRWAALRATGATRPSIERFTLAEDGLRTVKLWLPEGTDWAAAETFCADLALHDWLLTTLARLVERGGFGSTDGHEAVRALRPAVGLLHLWMPMARTENSTTALWETLEREPGFTRQWQTLAQRIRDRLALRAILGGPGS